MLGNSYIPVRSPHPRMPSYKLGLMLAALFVAGLAAAPNVRASAPLSLGTASTLGTPVAQLISLRQADWQNTSARYAGLPYRSAQLNTLMQQSVELLTRGSAVESRQRLLALQASLQSNLRELQRLKLDAALTPASPCDQADAALLNNPIGAISCRFASTRSDRLAAVKEAEGTIAQRLAQIGLERNRLTTDLKSLGLDVSGDQVDSLLKLSSASDLLTLQVAYGNLRTITGQLRSAMIAAKHEPLTAQRYYGIYVVLLEVAMHMHEDFYIKVQNQYLPQIDKLTADTQATLTRNRTLASQTGRSELKAQLQANAQTLTATLAAAQQHRAQLVTQAAAINSNWQQLFAQHEVAVNSYRTASLKGQLIDQIKESGNGFNSLQQISVPALESLGHAAQQHSSDSNEQDKPLPNS